MLHDMHLTMVFVEVVEYNILKIRDWIVKSLHVGTSI